MRFAELQRTRRPFAIRYREHDRIVAQWRFVAIAASALALVSLYGMTDYRSEPDQGWCLHMGLGTRAHMMVCHNQPVTDYVLGAHGY